MRYTFVIAILLFCSVLSYAQKRDRKAPGVYVDRSGVMRWNKDNREAAFFGINYTVPFAYGYRSVQRLGIPHEQAIDEDVYHFARLGFDAFRVHVWDTEITDSLGNLKENEHLRLFDYLIQKLKERNIKIFLTPLAFWGPGYPEPDPKTGSFSSIWNKRQVLVTEAAIRAQENYIRQLLRHVNPYTKMTYGQDPDVIALEINNEPHHSGTKEGAADYIRRMIAAAKGEGWAKPIFYNISESPAYAEVVAKADIQGVSFQWYPTGLVANRKLKGNFLPHVDQYRIPFDTIPAYRNKARMVYEFDAGDVYGSYMYPAMARSFRAAGFQWATQFAWDPMATAYGNTEYQTHYVNLAYTPSKAISLMIAGKAFHRLPRGKSWGTYPQDTLFDVFRVSYRNDLSEMNAPEEFYYSNSTATKPVNSARLRHVAGVGSSPVVRYEGRGAYFLDKLFDGVWRLEVMPDAVLVRDPFERASPRKEVTRIEWREQEMEIRLPDLGLEFNLASPDPSGPLNAQAQGGKLRVHPGVYVLTAQRNWISVVGRDPQKGIQVGKDLYIGLNEFVAPRPFSTEPVLYHQPLHEVSAGKPFSITATIAGIDTADRASLELRTASNRWRTLPMQEVKAYTYAAEVPADLLTPGLLQYRIILRRARGDFHVFPGNHRGDPYAWDNYLTETWTTLVASPHTHLVLFNPMRDRQELTLYNPDWRNNAVEYVTGEAPGRLIFRAVMKQPAAGAAMGWQLYVGDPLKGRREELDSFRTLVMRVRAPQSGGPMKVALIDRDGMAYSTQIPAGNLFADLKLPLSALQPDSSFLLPRPYPGFHPLRFRPGSVKPFALAEIEKLEVSFGPGASPAERYELEIESIYLKRD